MLEDQDLSFDMVRVKYINLNSLTFLPFTKLESSTSQGQTKVTYKIDSETDGNLFNSLFQKATI